ncbi:hypothetical protein [Pseudonocardia sp.]|uniref:hypothetical protein n=1 Tax=Pseudonocardia sp. TaxID=60912 RepID=UPI002617E0DF|nr:hypothetical protein [Pseudonocardia sp.]
MPGSELALADALADLLARSGARAVRVVDGRAGRVVGSAGAPAPDGGDDPGTVAGLVRDAVALGRGGLDDVVVTTDRSMHVLRPAAVPGVFLHLSLGLEGVDVGRARHALAAPALHAAIRAALAPDPRAAGIPRPRPAPRTPAQQPALAGLVGQQAPAGHGTRAAGVLAELIQPSPADRSLPRRRPAATRRPRPPGAVTVGLPERVWARDVDTMRRLALGLRRLS